MKWIAPPSLLLVLVVSLPAARASAEPVSHRQAALELLEVANSKQLVEQMLASVDQMMKKQFASLDLPPEGRQAAERMHKEALDWSARIFSWEKTRDLYIDIYVDVFSEEEIRELIAFYRSPLGAKLLARMPQLLEKSMAKTQALLEQAMPELQERLRKNLDELRETYEG